MSDGSIVLWRGTDDRLMAAGINELVGDSGVEYNSSTAGWRMGAEWGLNGSFSP